MLLLIAASCSLFEQQPPLPEKIEGMWELLEVEISNETFDARKQLLDSYPGCVWARSTWTFDADHIEAGIDLLCSAAEQTPSLPPPADGTAPPAADPAAPAAAPAAPAEDKSPVDYYGCQVSVRVPAIWDTEAGSWHVEETVTARARTRGLDIDAIGVPTSCSLTLPAGEYQVAKVQRKPWRWEMLTPLAPPTSGGLMRLKLPDSDRPDFVAALKSASAPTEPSTMGNP